VTVVELNYSGTGNTFNFGKGTSARWSWTACVIDEFPFPVS